MQKFVLCGLAIAIFLVFIGGCNSRDEEPTKIDRKAFEGKAGPKFPPDKSK
jgi:hypothetical protein